MKTFLKILTFFLVFLGIVWYLLLPSNPVTDTERFGSWQEKTNIITLVQQAVSNLASTESGLTSQMVVSNQDLKSILNENLNDQQKVDLADSAIAFGHSQLQVRQPYPLFGFLTSQLEFNMDLVSSEGRIQAIIKSAKFGKLPVPKFLLKMLVDQDSISADFDRENLSLNISLPGEGYSIESIEIRNQQAIVYLKFDRERLLSFIEEQLQ